MSKVYEKLLKLQQEVNELVALAESEYDPLVDGLVPVSSLIVTATSDSPQNHVVKLRFGDSVRFTNGPSLTVGRNNQYEIVHSVLSLNDTPLRKSPVLPEPEASAEAMLDLISLRE